MDAFVDVTTRRLQKQPETPLVLKSQHLYVEKGGIRENENTYIWNIAVTIPASIIWTWTES